jgi:hypothetical protein
VQLKDRVRVGVRVWVRARLRVRARVRARARVMVRFLVPAKNLSLNNALGPLRLAPSTKSNGAKCKAFSPEH